jgi:hypothetical protein
MANGLHPSSCPEDQPMFNAETQARKMAAVTGVLLMAVAEALAQEKTSRPARRILVSIPDRKLAVMEDDKVVRVFQTAVGAEKTPSPTGQFTIVQRIPDPTWYTRGLSLRVKAIRSEPVGSG